MQIAIVATNWIFIPTGAEWRVGFVGIHLEAPTHRQNQEAWLSIPKLRNAKPGVVKDRRDQSSSSARMNGNFGPSEVGRVAAFAPIVA